MKVYSSYALFTLELDIYICVNGIGIAKVWTLIDRASPIYLNVSLNASYCFVFDIRRAWKYQRGNQNPYINEEQTTQWPKEKVQKDKQRSTKHTYTFKDRVTRTPLKIRDELRCSGRVSSFCSTSGTRLVNLDRTSPIYLNVSLKTLYFFSLT